MLQHRNLASHLLLLLIDGKKTLVAPTFESLKQALGLDSKKYYSVDELNAAARDKGFDAPRAYLSGVEVYKRLSAKRSSATPTVEDVNVVKPTVPPGSKSGTPATEPRVEDGIGPDATQGTAEPKTPAAPGLGATVSDTSTDNVSKGSQSAALKALIEEMRAATSGDINAAIAKSLAKRAFAAGLIKQEDMGMALIARAAMKDAVDAYDAQPAPEQTTAAPIEEAKIAAEAALMAQMAEWRADETAAKKARIAAAAAQAAAKLEEAKIAAEADPAPGNEEFDFDFDEGFAGLDAARRAEKVAVDLKVAAEREAAAKLKDAQLPSIDGEVPDTVKGLGDARAAADARAKGYEQNINRITAESEQARANKLAADEAQAAQIAAERTQQYGKGDLPLSLVPAEYDPKDWGFRYGQRSARRCSPTGYSCCYKGSTSANYA
jgi:hypothetical protein